MNSRDIEPMRWEPSKLIYRPDGSLPWSLTHAQSPRALDLGDGILRLVFSTRDDNGRTRPGFIDVRSDNPAEVIKIGSEPLLDLGRPGTFDDCGVMPSCFLRTEDSIYLFYTGWNTSGTVPYRLALGLARSSDGGQTFEKVGEGPVMDRSLHEPISCSQPYVIPWKSGYRMYYISFFDWREINGRLESYYNLRYVDSTNLESWLPKGHIAVDCDDELTKAIAVPTVWKEDGKYRMVYSYRGDTDFRSDMNTAYRLGIAVSDDGDSWQRRDDLTGLHRSKAGWDSLMQAYPDYFSNDYGSYLFYSGNGFGQAGVGFARRIS